MKYIILFLVVTLSYCQDTTKFILSSSQVEQIFIQGYIASLCKTNDSAAFVNSKIVVDILNKSGKYINGKRIKIKHRR